MSESLAARVFREKRMVILGLLLLALVNVALYLGFVYPLQQRVANAGQRAATAARDLAQAQQQYRLANDTVAGKGRAEKELQRFYEQILPADQSAARRITYLQLAELARESNLRMGRRVFKVEEERNSSLRRLDITMVLEGSYSDIRRFIHELERSDEFVIITGIELVQREQSDAPELTLQLATYYRAVTDGS